MLWDGRFSRHGMAVAGLFTVPYAVVMFAFAELLNMAGFDFHSPEYLVYNLLLYALPAAFLLVLTRRPVPAFFLPGLAFTALSVGNHYYGILRDSPLEFFDIMNAKTAVNVVSNYTLTPDRETVAAFLALFLLLAILIRVFGFSGLQLRGRPMAAALAVLAAVSLTLYERIPRIAAVPSVAEVSSEYGYLLSFVSFMKAGKLVPPSGYSEERAEEILAEAEERWGEGVGFGNKVSDGLSESAGSAESPEFADLPESAEPMGSAEAAGSGIRTEREASLPNLIVIMDESFADLPELYGFEMTEDLLPNLHGLSENTRKGRLLVSVLGGGTSNTEYEFLTGNSLYFLPVGSSPYAQYMKEKSPSIAWKLRELGYSSAAYHPYMADSYRRTEVYPLLGLDPFYSEADVMPHGDLLRSFVSDSSDFKNVIHLYEERDPEQPFFLFNVTMQNHGGYSADEPAVSSDAVPVSEELQAPALLEYLGLIHETDAALGELIGYFSGVSEDTVILFFGDHQPGMDADTNAALDAAQLQRDGSSDPMRRYYANFVLWANFDIPEADDLITSPAYLRALLLQSAGVELNSFEKFLLELEEQYPAINEYGYLDDAGMWHVRGEETKGILEDYRYLIYRNMTASGGIEKI